MSKITPFVVGGLLGAGIALLYAPKSGVQTRSLIAEKTNALWGEAKDLGAGMPGAAQDVYKAAVAKGSSLVQDAPGKVKGFVGKDQGPAGDAAKSAPTDSDELRAKIEAARKRIAEQVKENAEQAKAVDVIPQADELKEAIAATAQEAAEAQAE